MIWLGITFSEHVGGLMIVGAAAAFYVASRAAGDAMTRAGAAAAGTSPLRHALAQWVSIALVALVATWLDQTAIAVGVIFSTSVAALSLHLGVAIASVGPVPRGRRPGHGFDVLLEGHTRPSPAGGAAGAGGAGGDVTVPARPPGTVVGSRAWAMILPVAVLALMAGFSGKLTLTHAILFVVQGLLVIMVWNEGKLAAPEATLPPAPALTPTQRAQLALASALGLVGAILAVYGAMRMSAETRIMSTGLIASAAIGPLLVLPMIGSSSLLAAHGQAQTAVGASIIIVLLNLCLLLPVVVTGWHVRERYAPPVAQAITPPATQPSTDEFADVEPAPMDDEPRVFAFPLAVWRIDTVLLILLGLMVVPVALNLWEFRRSEGFFLIAVYACYLVATTFLGRRW